MAVAKPLSFAADLKLFVENHKTTPYKDLLPAATEAGWEVLLQETEAVGQVDGTTLVRFSVAVGRDSKFEPYDMVTVKTGVGPGPVSIAARMLLPQSLTFLFFGRLPDAAPVPEQRIDASGSTEDIVLPGERPLEPEQDYVPDSAPIDRRAKIMPSLIDHNEPDGVPIFRDLDDMPEQFTDAQIIAQLLEDIDRAAVRFDSIAQLEAMFTKNSQALGPDKDAFLMALGTPEDRTTLKAILDKHQARIEAASGPAREVRIPGGKGSGSEAASPRRRRAA